MPLPAPLYSPGAHAGHAVVVVAARSRKYRPRLVIIYIIALAAPPFREELFAMPQPLASLFAITSSPMPAVKRRRFLRARMSRDAPNEASPGRVAAMLLKNFERLMISETPKYRVD